MTATAEVRRSARSGAIGLVGAAVNGVFGFVLTTVVTRTFGADGSGALFTVIGLITIAGAVACLGADTGLMWAVPRRPRTEAGRLLPVAVLPTLGLALVLGTAGFLAAEPVGRALLDSPEATALIRLAFAGVPVIVAATVLLAAVRATRPVGAYVLVQFVVVPVTRPLLVIAAVAAGGGVLLGFAGWLLPMAVAAVLALALVAGPLGLGRRPSGSSAPSRSAAPARSAPPARSSAPARSSSPGRGAVDARHRLRPRAGDWRSFWAFALPRSASVAIDAGSMWVGVLLTGALAGQAQAGVFAAVGRYALAGLLIMQGLRVAVAPQLSRLLGADRRGEAVQVYRRTTLWIVVLSWPVYLLLAVFAPAFLRLFGDGFAAGAAPMAVLAVAMLINVGVGLVQTVLLMSGDSRGHLLATAAGLAVNVASCLVLIPRHGALGAAIAWSLGIVCENLLAAVLARRALGAPLLSRALVVAAAAVTLAASAASATGVALGGRGLPGLAVTLGVLVAGGAAALTSGRVRAALSRARSLLRPHHPQESS